MSKRNYGNLQFGPRDEVAYAEVIEWLDSVEPYKRMAAVKNALQKIVLQSGTVGAQVTRPLSPRPPRGAAGSRPESGTRAQGRKAAAPETGSPGQSVPETPEVGGKPPLDETAARLARDLKSLFGV